MPVVHMVAEVVMGVMILRMVDGTAYFWVFAVPVPLASLPSELELTVRRWVFAVPCLPP